MARRARKIKAPATSNGMDPAIVKSIVERYDAIDERLRSAKAVYARAAKQAAEDKKELMAEAKGRGVPPKPLKVEIRCRNLGHKILAERASLEADDAEQAELIRDAINLLDTPLQQSPSAEEKRQEDADLANSLSGDDDED